MKNHLSKLLCLIIFVNLISGFSNVVSSESSETEVLTINYSKLESMLSDAADLVYNLEQSDRIAAYNFASSYMRENTGIDYLIGLIQDGSFENITEFESITDFASYLEEHKSEAVFLLSFIKSIPESERQLAFTKITNRTSFKLNSSQSNALNATYELYFSEEFINALNESHDITADILFNLIACLQEKFTVTDKKSDTKKIELKSNALSSTFKSSLETNLGKYFSSINNKNVSNGEEVLGSVIELLNNSGETQVANFKKLFDALGMYEKYEAKPTPTPSPRRTDGGSSPRIVVPVGSEAAVIPPPVVSEEAVKDIEDFNDLTVNHWSASYISALVSRNIFKGYEDNSFRPQQGITREEFAVVLVRTLGLETRLETVEDSSFADMDDFGDWSKKAVALLVEMQILQGYEDGTFKPNSIISRQELAVILARAIVKETEVAALDFADKDNVAPWAVDAIQKVYALGIIRGYEDKSFKPTNSVSREEVAVMLYNFMYTENLL